MKHILLRNPLLSGYQYGVLRALEEAILRITGAEIIEIPKQDSLLLKKTGHGMRFGFLRKNISKRPLDVEADVLWCILMGPETFLLDLFTGWEKVKHRVVYLFDTYPSHYKLIGELFSKNYFTIHITAFNEAKEQLESITKKGWKVVQHAGSIAFKPIPLGERGIAFSSYGRRLENFHRVLLEFCNANQIYYDYTNHNGKNPIAEPGELYRHYVWHLNHSIFNVSWPVELANQELAAGLHPVTCRWFEASCAGTILLGKKPLNKKFADYLFDNQVVEVDPFAGKNEIFKSLDRAWMDRELLFKKSEKLQADFSREMIWDCRVNGILGFIS